jgi:hypothetical protein
MVDRLFLSVIIHFVLISLYFLAFAVMVACLVVQDVQITPHLPGSPLSRDLRRNTHPRSPSYIDCRSSGPS